MDTFIKLSKENEAQIYSTASELNSSKTTFTPDEMVTFAKQVASRLKFMVNLKTVQNYLECKYITIINLKK